MNQAQSIKGKTRDKLSFKAMDSVYIELCNKDTCFIRTISDFNGNFQIVNIPNGIYSILAYKQICDTTFIENIVIENKGEKQTEINKDILLIRKNLTSKERKKLASWEERIYKMKNHSGCGCF